MHIMISMKYFLNLDFHQIIKLFLICKRNKKSKAPKGSIKLNKSLNKVYKLYVDVSIKYWFSTFFQEKQYTCTDCDKNIDARRILLPTRMLHMTWVNSEVKNVVASLDMRPFFLFIMSRGVLVKTRHFQLTSPCLVFKWHIICSITESVSAHRANNRFPSCLLLTWPLRVSQMTRWYQTFSLVCLTVVGLCQNDEIWKIWVLL
jgi:hypothetical protein